mmetsp:Transcript_35976/g.85755  ORF Transcript_35976/g.85755 Transcript_35976/m.85755 type:complete len:246 (-) Transcript_35976:684-1421(-)
MTSPQACWDWLSLLTPCYSFRVLLPHRLLTPLEPPRVERSNQYADNQRPRRAAGLSHACLGDEVAHLDEELAALLVVGVDHDLLPDGPRKRLIVVILVSVAPCCLDDFSLPAALGGLVVPHVDDPLCPRKTSDVVHVFDDERLLANHVTVHVRGDESHQFPKINFDLLRSHLVILREIDSDVGKLELGLVVVDEPVVAVIIIRLGHARDDSFEIDYPPRDLFCYSRGPAKTVVERVLVEPICEDV